jgi:hypothetical protein
MTVSVLKPGILVSLKTALRGGIFYDRRDLESEHREGDASIAKWETKRKIDDAAEYERATKARNAASSAIRSVCAHTAFGLLCPESDEPKLDAALISAREIVNAFNETARHSQVSVYVLKGRIATTDQEAAKAIASEVEGLLGEMERGIRNVDAKAIREAASRAKQVGAVLDANAGTRVNMAIEIARAAAREIVKRVEKGGEDVLKVAESLTGSTSAIETARMSFLDLDVTEQPVVEPLPATQARDLEVG